MRFGACIDDDGSGAAPVLVFGLFAKAAQVDRGIGSGECDPSPIFDGSACELSVICKHDKCDLWVVSGLLVNRWVLVPSVKDRIEICFGFDCEDSWEAEFWVGQKIGQIEVSRQ